jgi:hypothetical protein
MHALAALILYGNAAVALQPHALRNAGLGLPRSAALTDAFLMTGMFSSFNKHNSDLFIVGERTQAGRAEDRGQWIPLQVREHFPARLGVAFTQMFVVRHWDTFGQNAQRRAWRGLAARIRAHHNRLHPEAEVARVRLGQVDWPQSPKGYRAAKRGAKVRSTTWFEERAPKATKP